jgi:tRNA(Arg) A34 adenosine deaminase TadA
MSNDLMGDCVEGWVMGDEGWEWVMAMESKSNTVDSGPSHAEMLQHLRSANQVAVSAFNSGHHPFGAVLVAPDNQTVLAEQGNVDTLNHAESVLIRQAYSSFSPAYLWSCTLYTTVEPCVMCAGTLYWANIGRLVYGISEALLLSLTGNHEQNPTMNLPCRYVFDHGQKQILVVGPFSELEAEILAPHRDFWNRPDRDE